MADHLGPERVAAWEAAVDEAALRDEEQAVAYAAASAEEPATGSSPPSWWHGDEEASSLAIGWAAKANKIDGVTT